MQTLKNVTLVGLYLAANVSIAAGFNCAQASNFIETTICKNTALNFKDSYMSILYTKLADQELTPALRTLKTSQKKWMQQRNQCTTVACITDIYDQRIKELEQFDQSSQELSSSPIKGKWTASYSNQNAAATVDINTVDENGFDFQIQANNGANSGEVSGKALFINNNALMVDNSMVEDASFTVPCILLFQQIQNKLQVTQNESCTYYAGNGVVFAGAYEHNGIDKIASMKQQGFLDNEQQEQAFKEMTGNSGYKLFLDTCGGMKNESKSTQPEAIVREGFMRGVANSMACIVMLNQNTLWAAVMSEEPNQIMYYTNAPAFKNVLPSSILGWVKNMEKVNGEKMTIIYPTE